MPADKTEVDRQRRAGDRAAAGWARNQISSAISAGRMNRALEPWA